MSLRRLDLVELLLARGADVKSVPLTDVLLTWEPSLIRFFLEHGANPIAGRPFAEAFGAKVRTALRPFVEYKRAHPESLARSAIKAPFLIESSAPVEATRAPSQLDAATFPPYRVQRQKTLRFSIRIAAQTQAYSSCYRALPRPYGFGFSRQKISSKVSNIEQTGT